MIGRLDSGPVVFPRDDSENSTPINKHTGDRRVRDGCGTQEGAGRTCSQMQSIQDD
jgi:hypothetical protein